MIHRDNRAWERRLDDVRDMAFDESQLGCEKCSRQDSRTEETQLFGMELGPLPAIVTDIDQGIYGLVFFRVRVGVVLSRSNC